jgi:outer membrane immunogenic protein
MRRSMGAAVAFAAATDLPSRKKAPDISAITKRSHPFWSGYYIGAGVGYGWNALHYGSGYIGPDNINTGSTKGSGGQFAIRIGQDHDFGNGYMTGLVADLSLSSVGKSSQCLTLCDVPGAGYSGAVKIPAFASFRSRFGMIAGANLFYVTSGFGIAEVQTEILGDKSPTRVSKSEMRFAGTIGGGYEHKITETVSVGAEYLYYKFGDRIYDYAPDNTPAKIAIGDSMNQIKATLNYRF